MHDIHNIQNFKNTFEHTKYLHVEYGYINSLCIQCDFCGAIYNSFYILTLSTTNYVLLHPLLQLLVETPSLIYTTNVTISMPLIKCRYRQCCKWQRLNKNLRTYVAQYTVIYSNLASYSLCVHYSTKHYIVKLIPFLFPI